MKAKKFDADLDGGKDVTAALDLSKARRPLQKQRRVNVDFPEWMIESLDTTIRLNLAKNRAKIAYRLAELSRSVSGRLPKQMELVCRRAR